MLPIHYEVVGEEDYAFVVTVNEDGSYTVSSGTYTSDPPRGGKLSTEQEEQLREAVLRLGIPRPHEAPEGAAEAFRAKLTIGSDEDARTFPFWEGALEEDSGLLKLVRLLETL